MQSFPIFKLLLSSFLIFSALFAELTWSHELCRG
jgi:hypothetical protein